MREKRSNWTIAWRKRTCAKGDDAHPISLFLPQQRVMFDRIALFRMEEFETAKSFFASGAKLDPNNGVFSMWLRKCDAEMEGDRFTLNDGLFSHSLDVKRKMPKWRSQSRQKRHRRHRRPLRPRRNQRNGMIIKHWRQVHPNP